jgi:hypothetical protein
VVGRQAGREPFTVEPHGDTGPIPYPSYEIITVNGVTDVVEHRKMEAIFYVATDPEVRRKIVGQVSAIQ